MIKTQLNIELEPELIEVLEGLAGKALKRQAVVRAWEQPGDIIEALQGCRHQG